MGMPAYGVCGSGFSPTPLEDLLKNASMTFRPAECPIFGAVARPYGPLCVPTTMNPGHRPRPAQRPRRSDAPWRKPRNRSSIPLIPVATAQIAITDHQDQEHDRECAMTDNIESLVLENLRAIRATQDKHTEPFSRIDWRISNLELTVAGMRRDLAHMYGEIVEQHAHTDQLVARIERNERRLELQDS